MLLFAAFMVTLVSPSLRLRAIPVRSRLLSMSEAPAASKEAYAMLDTLLKRAEQGVGRGSAQARALRNRWLDLSATELVESALILGVSIGIDFDRGLELLEVAEGDTTVVPARGYSALMRLGVAAERHQEVLGLLARARVQDATASGVVLSAMQSAGALGDWGAVARLSEEYEGCEYDGCLTLALGEGGASQLEMVRSTGPPQPQPKPSPLPNLHLSLQPHLSPRPLTLHLARWAVPRSSLSSSGRALLPPTRASSRPPTGSHSLSRCARTASAATRRARSTPCSRCARWACLSSHRATVTYSASPRRAAWVSPSCFRRLTCYSPCRATLTIRLTPPYHATPPIACCTHIPGALLALRPSDLVRSFGGELEPVLLGLTNKPNELDNEQIELLCSSPPSPYPYPYPYAPTPTPHFHTPRTPRPRPHPDLNPSQVHRCGARLYRHPRSRTTRLAASCLRPARLLNQHLPEPPAAQHICTCVQQRVTYGS